MQNGSKLLKVVSILMIVFGGLGILGVLIGLAGTGLMAAMTDELAAFGIDEELMQDATTALYIGLIGFAAQLTAGIIGVKNHNKPEKHNICLLFACIVIVLQLFGNIFDIATGGLTGMTVMNIVIGLAVPVLYLIGTLQLKKLADGGQEQPPVQPMH